MHWPIGFPRNRRKASPGVRRFLSHVSRDNHCKTSTLILHSRKTVQQHQNSRELVLLRKKVLKFLESLVTLPNKELYGIIHMKNMIVAPKDLL
ncbi:hypothetical protein DMN91_004114 [Ooceraea biroi]|uniref:Uncharacterized protein n=1 Tax=Ooceraea biroi TaxID=2015173 RepID=A0A3L8DUF1_OOCBI|nr:hypothetical protein DMN91_004114 [Ooceraea biroi]